MRPRRGRPHSSTETPFVPGGRTIGLIKVQVRPNESLEAALRRFKRQCNYTGIFKMAKQKSFFEKPTTAR
ncbi:MAG: 30S ribosomal protein S21, partial [Planctomycetota bacterium]